MLRRLAVGGALISMAVLLPSCVLYSNGEGNASLDGGNIKFAIKASLSQAQSQVYQNCGGFAYVGNTAAFNCYASITTSLTSDPIGLAALVDCPAEGPSYECGRSEIPALWGRLFTNPGGFPYSTSFESRCLVFEVNQNGPNIFNQANASYIWSTWGWVRHGNWACSS